MVVVLIPVAEAETVVLPAAPEVAAGVLAALGVLEDEEPPHAASPTTAAAARTEPANHRLRIVSTPFVTVTRSAFNRRARTGDRNSSGFVRSKIQAAMRWQSQASESGYRYSMAGWGAAMR